MKRRCSTIKGEKKTMVQKIRGARGFAFSGTVVSASAPRRGAIQVPKVKGGKRTMNRTGIKKMLTTTVLAAMAVLLVFSASAVCELGTADFDVSSINQTTILLNDTCAPLRCSYEDVNGDGYMDLVLKFDTQRVVGCLPESCEDGDIVTLVLTAKLYDDTEIAGSDDVRVLIKGKGN
jgi:hypothetical protein